MKITQEKSLYSEADALNPSIQSPRIIPLFKLLVLAAPSFIIVVIMGVAVLFSGASAHAAQTKELCMKCCDDKHGDEYYAERCRLKCHRDPDHCQWKEKKSKKPPKIKEEKEKRPKRRARRRPPRERQSQRQTVTLRFPNPLNIEAGQEWKTAVELLVLNGINSRHPKFVQAVEGVEKILINFRLQNPQGGELPTDLLEREIVKYK